MSQPIQPRQTVARLSSSSSLLLTSITDDPDTRRKVRNQSQSPSSTSQLLLGWPTLSQNDERHQSKIADRTTSIIRPGSKRPRYNNQSVSFHRSIKSATSTHSSSSRNGTRINGSNSIDNSDSNYVTWCEKYQPKQAIDLCVAPKKIREVASWIDEAFFSPLNPKFLVLVGSPGIGKSTMIQCLAAERHWDVKEWTESYSTYFPQNSSSNENTIQIDQQSPLQSFEHFLQRCGLGFSPLQLVPTGSNAQDKSKSAEMSRNCSNSLNSLTSQQNHKKNCIIVIDEIPYLHGHEMEEKFRDLMSNHIYQSVTPTVFVYSNVTEGKHRPYDLERLIDKELLYSSRYVRIMQIHVATKVKFKKSLERIIHMEHIPIQNIAFSIDDLFDQCSGDIRSAINMLQFQLTNAQSEDGLKNANVGTKTDKCSSSSKDVKLSSFHTLGKLLYAKRKIQQHRTDTISSKKISFLNSSVKPDQPQDKERPPLDFDPESLISESCDMEIGKVLLFLNYHCVEFFTDVCELTTALDDFSDAAAFLDTASHNIPSRGYRISTSPGDSILYPAAYVSSLASRAVANANLHPAPTRFKQFTSPQSYQVSTKQNANAIITQQMMQRLMTSVAEPYNTAILSRSNNDFLLDMLPYLRIIIPSSMLRQTTYSYFRRQPNSSHDSNDSYDENEDGDDLFVSMEVNDNIELDEEDYFVERLKEQEEILKLDDIVEEIADEDLF